MKNKRNIEILLTKDGVNESMALSVIMKTIDLVRKDKRSREVRDEYCKTERKAG